VKAVRLEKQIKRIPLCFGKTGKRIAIHATYQGCTTGDKIKRSNTE